MRGGAGPKAAAFFLVAAVALAGLALTWPAEPAEAVFATGGENDAAGRNARFRQLIDWFDWGSAANGDPVSIYAGTYTSQRQAGNVTLTTTCVLSNLKGDIRSKKPGSFGGDSLDDLYNIGGTGTANQMWIGITNATGRSAVSFDFDCSLTIKTGSEEATVALPGLVVADAESATTFGTNEYEYIRATPKNPNTTWRIIQTRRAVNCESATLADLTTGGQLTLRPSQSECTNGSPTAVAFMDGSAGAHVELLGRGNSAIAIGVVSYIDWGDAPADYGAAGVFGFPTWSGGELTPGTTGTNLFASDFQLGDVNQPGLRLGHYTDGEALPPYSADATGDDNNAAPNDEDLAVPAQITGYRGGQVRIENLVCAGDGKIWGWIDFDHDKVFEPGEMGGPIPTGSNAFKAGPIECGSTDGVEKTFSIAWTVPSDAVPTQAGQLTMVRFGITTDERALGNTPIGVAVNGELEDHGVDFRLDPYTIAKTSDANSEARSGKVVNYQIVVTTPVGDAASTTPSTITVRDNLANLLQGGKATLDQSSFKAEPDSGQFAFAGAELSWTGPPPPGGQSVTLSYSATLNSSGDELDNVAWIDNAAQTQTVTCQVDSPTGSGRDPVTDEPCAYHSFDTPRLELAKSSTHTASDRAGAVVQYTVTATNAGPGDFTQGQPAVVMDDISGLVGDGLTGNAEYLGDLTASLTGITSDKPPVLAWSGVLRANESVTLKYSVRLRSTGDGQLRNVAWQPADPDNPATPACDGDAPTTGLDPATQEVCAAHEFGAPRLELDKTMAANPDPPVPGGAVSYTVTAKNVGGADFLASRPLVLADDIGDVLDGGALQTASLKAAIQGESNVPQPTLDAVNGLIKWSGPLARGQTVVITYTLDVLGHGNGQLLNTVWGPRGQTVWTDGGVPPATPTCQDGFGVGTEEPCASVLDTRPLIGLSKTAATNTTTGPVPGSRVTYTITGVNSGKADYTEQDPAPIWDDLSQLLAGATLDPASLTASLTPAAGAVPQPTFDSASNLIKWEGALAQGQTVTIQYTVELWGTGPATLRNVAWVPRLTPFDPPDCDQAPGAPDDPDTHEVCAAVALPRPLLKVVKQASGPGAATGDWRASDQVHYTVTATNVGAAAFTQGGPALVRDNLTDTLDDAAGPANLSASPATAPAPTFNSETGNISWSGVLAPGASVEIGYDMVLKTGGDGSAPDVAWAASDRASPTPPACVDTTTSGPPDNVVSDAASRQPCGRVALYLPAVSITKTATPNQGLSVGDEVVFEVAFKNSGAADYSSDPALLVVDSLAATLADATLVSPPALDPATDPAYSGYFTWDPLGVWRYSGPLEMGDEVKVTYRVKLNSGGDGQLRNVAYEPVPGAQTTPTCSNVVAGIDQATGAACGAAQIDFPVLRIAKVSDIATDVSPGTPVTYRVTITNISAVDFPGAVVMDDISGVLTGAAWPAGAEPSVTGPGSASYTAPIITWTGDLPAGQRAVVEYKVTAQSSQANQLVNVAWQPANPANPGRPACDPAPGGVDQTSGEPCARVASPTRAVELTKQVAFEAQGGGAPPAAPAAGDRAVYTITAENTSAVPYDSDNQLVLRDDLSELLQAASLDTDSWAAVWQPASGADDGRFEVSGTHLIWRGTLAVGQTVSLTYQAVVGPGGPGAVANVVWEPAEPYDPDPDPPVCADALGAANGRPLRDAAFAEACSSASFTRPVLAITKAAEPADPDKEGPLVTGDKVLYTITLANNGEADFTAAAPARLSDSLAAMSDGADYQDDAVVAYLDPAEADQASSLSYDDASRILSWHGPLQAGHKATITYTAKLKGEGPGVLVNTAWVPSNPAQQLPPAVCPKVPQGEFALCAQATVPRALMHIEKTTQAPEQPRAGDKVYYTIILRNIGTAGYTADGGPQTSAYLLDELAGVLTGALYDNNLQVVDDAGNETGSAVFLQGPGTPARPRLQWKGPLPAGAGVTATFSVTLTGDGGGQIDNLAWSPADPDNDPPPALGDCPPTADLPDPGSTGRCASSQLERTQVEVAKQVAAPAVPHTGDLLTYSVTMRNTGKVAFAPERPAVLVDDLTDVLTGGIYQRDASAAYTDPAGAANSPEYAAPRLTWSGPLAVGQSVTLTYTVMLRGSTETGVRNVAWSPSDPFSPAAPPKPDCAGSDAGVDPARGEPCASQTLRRALVSIEKSVAPQDPAALPGDILTYSIKISNTSGTDFTEQDPAWVLDDMTQALPDAIYVAGSLKAEPDVGEVSPAADWPRVSWHGPLADGETVTLSYQVRVSADGDGHFRNVAWVPLDPHDTGAEPPSCVGSNDGTAVTSVATGQTCAGLTLQGPALALRKWSRPSGLVLPGDLVTYTIEASNSGAGPYTEANPMVVFDDMSGVLDDAAYVAGSAHATMAGQELASPSVTAEGLLSWSGPVAAGEMVRITYQVRLHGGGDGQARNLAWGPLPDPDNPAVYRDQPDCDQDSGQFDPDSGQACGVEQRSWPKLALAKELLTAGPYAQGATAQYRLTIANPSQAAFTAGQPAQVVDDLADILDGSRLESYEVAQVTGQQASGTLSFSGTLLRWSGPLAAGAEVVITYTVTWNASGNGSLRNVAWQPIDPDNPTPPACPDPQTGWDAAAGEVCAVAEAARPLLEIGKTSDGHNRELAPGDIVKYTVTARNHGQADYTADGPAVVVDDVGNLLTGATFNDDAAAEVAGQTAAAPQFDPATGLLRWEGALPAGRAATITFSITLTGGGNGAERNVAWSPADPTLPNPPPPACSDASEPLDLVTGEPCSADMVSRPSLTIQKVSDAENSRPGDTVTYSVWISNVSLQDFTADNPAIVYDDLSGLLDDADFAGLADVSTTPAAAAAGLDYTAPILSWRGPLASTESIGLKIKVVLHGGGDGIVRNVAWRPNDAKSFVPPVCDRSESVADLQTQEPCGVTEFAMQALRVTKAANPPDPMPGATVTYTLTLENTGAVDFTWENPAVLLDDLSELLANGGKLAGPPSAYPPGAGQVNTDDLSEQGRFTWYGPLAQGQKVEVFYAVTLGSETMAVSHASNVAWVPNDPAEPEAPDCRELDGHGADDATGEPCARVTLTPPVLEIAKTSTTIRPGQADPPAYPRPGDTIQYTLTVANKGSGAYTAKHPAVVVDALGGVLDNASWDGTQAVQPEIGNLVWNGANERLSWSGELQVGQSVVITYSVTVKSGGDGQMLNVVWVPDDPDQPGEPPACDPDAPPGDWLACDGVPIPALKIAKTALATPPGGGLQAGVRLTYTLALTNTGQGDFTAAAPAQVRDDLSDLLDDAVWAGLVDQPAEGAANWESPVLAWQGPIPAGQTVKLTYALDLTAEGDGELRNLAWAPADPSLPDPPEPACEAAGGLDPERDEPCAVVELERPILDLESKTVSPASGAQLGDWLTYQVVARNTGSLPFTAAVLTDSLAGLLDDIEPFDLATASDGGAGGAFKWDSPVLSWTGPLAVGAAVTLTYKVRLAPGGDGDLRNVVWVPIDPSPTPPQCPLPMSGPLAAGRLGAGARVAALDPDCAATETPVPALTVDKSVEVAPPLGIGSQAKFTITLTNTGKADFTAARPGFMADDMEDVLDDASWVGDAAATLGAVDFEAPRLVWTGALKVGQTATIAYTMRLTGQGDGQARNLAWVTGSKDEAWFAAPPLECAAPGCSGVEIPGPLPPLSQPSPSPQMPVSGAAGAIPLTWAALAALVLGAALARRGRRRPGG
ncbi:MAG: CshA/CshB family fibrillar adhesin-related protein [Bifidobacteriaceae bacterium]|jgi:uncharacterized repeat protein (TIGR01451 family)|nr:CshA/CshB family fibrillar adhesin-related protein [Bifidobacteriaceae bacterium]